MCRCLSFSSVDSFTPDSTPVYSEDEEEDFQMVTLDDEHWTSEETPERTLCIMNMVYHMDYASTHVLTQTMKLSPTWTVWI